MIRQLRIVQTDCTDPHDNLALEEHLLRTLGADCCTLYLWQNRNTVVIGSNQNAWRECRTELLEAEGGTLARRLSGGGAVFHDLGNLNFTFFAPKADYDQTRQFRVIAQACRTLGVPAELSGRNDLLAAGRKFSGNAFFHSPTASYHHGTLLVEADMEKLSRYLRPSAAKLRAKGVESVRSRVVNLRELKPELTIDALKAALAAAFEAEYGMPAAREQAEPAPDALREKYHGWAWNYGRKLPFDFSCEDRFPWGEVQLELAVEGGTVARASVYTDAMETEAAPLLEAALTGCRFTREALCAAAKACNADVADLIAKQDIW